MPAPSEDRACSMKTSAKIMPGALIALCRPGEFWLSCPAGAGSAWFSPGRGGAVGRDGKRWPAPDSGGEATGRGSLGLGNLHCGRANRWTPPTYTTQPLIPPSGPQVQPLSISAAQAVLLQRRWCNAPIRDLVVPCRGDVHENLDPLVAAPGAVDHQQRFHGAGPMLAAGTLRTNMPQGVSSRRRSWEWVREDAAPHGGWCRWKGLTALFIEA